ncbi:hypothetical protein [Raoultibacter phocaeensis]|uniref:hypothetical protein n=1 Tax=Raoultibacter phocaeensis TaxID=2479841 RepID=UPI0011192491|nr:hypothetical protein [Raoultibacter phocaeensis]
MEHQESTITTRGVVISCVLTAVIVVVLAALISLTAPPEAKATTFDSSGFDYFGLQEKTSARNAEINDRIREEAHASALRNLQITDETEEAETGEADESEAADHVSTDLLAFDIPSYWHGRVDIEQESDGVVSVYSASFPAAPLIAFTVQDASEPADTGSADYSMMYSKVNGDNQRIELWMTNFAWLVFNLNRPDAPSPEGWQADLLDPEVAEDLVSLQTLGTVPAEKIIHPAKIGDTQFETQVDWENAVNEIVPTIVVK